MFGHPNKYTTKGYWKFFCGFLLMFAVFAASLPLLAAQDNEPQAIENKGFSPKPPRSNERAHATPSTKNAPEVDFGVPPPSLLTQGTAIAMMALFPFIIMLLTPFVKIVVVLSLLRTALGVQNSPPNMVINGLALLLSLFIMYPVAAKMYDAAQPVVQESTLPDAVFSKDTPAFIIKVAQSVQEPLRTFLQNNTEVQYQRLFYRMIYKGLPSSYRDVLTPNDMIVLVPSFITGQLKQAFEIGVLIYIPFFVIDLVVSNILLAMGMMMLSPVTISMPLKIFLLVMLDGWTILIQGLVQTFRV